MTVYPLPGNTQQSKILTKVVCPIADITRLFLEASKSVAEAYNRGMLKIDCTGLTIHEGRELATYLQSRNGVSKVRLDIDVDLTGMQTRSVQMSIQHFYLLIYIAEGGIGAVAAGAAGDIGKDIYKAIKGWMARFSDKTPVSVEVKLYGADGRLIDKIEKTR